VSLIVKRKVKAGSKKRDWIYGVYAVRVCVCVCVCKCVKECDRGEKGDNSEMNCQADNRLV